MTKTEIMEQIKSLEKQIANLKEEVNIYSEDVGFEDDDIFLLSYKEYKTYKDVIPSTYVTYWLRNSPGIKGNPRVSSNGNILYSNISPSCSFGVRPVIKLSEYYNDPIGTIITAYNFPWVSIDPEKHLYIAEVPIAQTLFDSSNYYDYKYSYIRNFLKNWLKQR